MVATVEKVPLGNPTADAAAGAAEAGVSPPPNKIDTVDVSSGGSTAAAAPALLDTPTAEGVVAEAEVEPPYERIPAECFTMVFDCKQSPQHMCCPYQQHM